MADTELTMTQLQDGIALKTGTEHELKLPSLICYLDINPEDAASRDDKYTLYSTDENQTYKKTLTVSDDHIKGDEYTELYFPCICTDLLYTLQIDPGKEGEPYNAFEALSYEEMKGL